MKKIIIVGGGLAGMIIAIRLMDAGIHSVVIEKKAFPFHRVCGEYISHEATPFLRTMGLYPEALNPATLARFMLSSIHGKSETLPLDLGGFGVSRYAFDDFIYREALRRGVTFQLRTEVAEIRFSDDRFVVKTNSGQLQADIVIGAFGKRSRLDVQMARRFTRTRSPYVGIKYHVRTTHPADLVALHNFPGGYCGICNVEDGKTNVCYLARRDMLRASGSIPRFQEEVLFRNPLLRDAFANIGTFVHGPETINEISFDTKLPVEDHILMAGDAAGMITPLCGNGMAMAIHSGKILADLIIRHCSDNRFTRAMLESTYTREWKARFQGRLWTGRQVQRLFGNSFASSAAVRIAMSFKPVAATIMRNTHGPVF
ncbi:MAG TPA: NAD(P)/FAD-dependent oxidoreductase [Ohtaekwangia sp.]|nr:NAD(P)/FAD-dependent oxidoreductase [Ohtaekwangia sp.]